MQKRSRRQNKNLKKKTLSCNILHGKVCLTKIYYVIYNYVITCAAVIAPELRFNGNRRGVTIFEKKIAGKPFTRASEIIREISAGIIITCVAELVPIYAISRALSAGEGLISL